MCRGGGIQCKIAQWPIQVSREQAWDELHCKVMHYVTITSCIRALNYHYHYLIFLK